MVQLATIHQRVLDAGGRLWAISPQAVADNRALQARHELPFPILADDDQEVIRRWGIFDHQDPKNRSIPHPASYVVGANGRIAWHHVGRSSRDRPTVGELLAALTAAAGDTPPGPAT